MRHLFLLLTALTFCHARPRKDRWAISHVEIIDVAGDADQQDRAIIIEGDRIVDVVAADTIPPGMKIVDARGKYVIPGLWDMHVHFNVPSSAKLFVANGVTGVRVMWGTPKAHEMRRTFDSKRELGPRMVIASGIMDGPKPIWPGSLALATPADARREIAAAKREGADFIKVYSLLPRDVYLAIADESRRLGLPFAGHVPDSVTVAEASDSGQRSIEHLTGMISSDDFDKLRANRTWQCPTLTVLKSMSRLDDPSLAKDARVAFVPWFVVKHWNPKNDFRTKDRTPADYERHRERAAKKRTLVGALHRAGVPMLAGTDEGNPYCFAGFSLHDELASLVAAGLTPREALRTATWEPARYFGAEKTMGSVAAGKVADLVVLDADPRTDIKNTTQIHAVMTRGTYLDRPMLDHMLAEVKRAP